MTLDAVIHKLLEFGISQREALTFVTLSRHGPSNAREISQRTGIDRVQTYQVLGNLQAKGFVDFTMERPRRYLAVPVERILDRHFTDRAGETQRKEDARSLLLDLWPSVVDVSEEAPAIRFQMIRGTGPITSALGQFSSQAREVLAFTTSKGLLTYYLDEIQHSLGQVVARGGCVRVISEVDQTNASMIKAYATSPMERIEIRHLDRQLARLAVVDRKEVLVHLIPTGSLVKQETALWTNSQEFVQALVEFFEDAWPRARPAVERLVALGASII